MPPRYSAYNAAAAPSILDARACPLMLISHITGQHLTFKAARRIGGRAPLRTQHDDEVLFKRGWCRGTPFAEERRIAGTERHFPKHEYED